MCLNDAFDKESYLDLSLASQLQFVAKIEVPQDLYGALVDMDSVGCIQQTIRSFPDSPEEEKLLLAVCIA